MVTHHALGDELFFHRSYLGPQGGQRPYSYLFGTDMSTPPNEYRYPFDPVQSNRSQFYNFEGVPLGTDGRPVIYDHNGDPIVTLTADSAPPYDVLPTWRAFNARVYHGLISAETASRSKNIQVNLDHPNAIRINRAVGKDFHEDACENNAVTINGIYCFRILLPAQKISNFGTIRKFFQQFSLKSVKVQSVNLNLYRIELY